MSKKENNTTNENILSYAKAMVGASPSVGGRGSSGNVSRARLEGYFRNPIANYENIANAMETFVSQDGIVKRVINYFVALPTYNYNISLKMDGTEDVTKVPETKDYLTAANWIEQYNPKLHAPYFVKRTLISGISFFYEMEDADGVAYLEFPIGMGRVYAMDNGVYRWAINVSMLSDEIVEQEGFPEEIAKAYKTPTRARTTNNGWSDENYYMIGEKGVAFCFDQSVIRNGGIAISEFADLLLQQENLEKAKDNVGLKDDIETVRIIHGEIPRDKDGNLTMTSQQAFEFRQSLESGLPNGVAAVVTPFELTNVPLGSSSQNKAYETLQDAYEQIYRATGQPSPLFGGKTTSYNIVKLSIMKDATWVYNTIIQHLNSYYNSIMMRVNTNSKWSFKFLEQSIFTEKEDVAKYKEAVTLGGSRTDYLASLGLKPIEIYGKLTMEQKMLDIDSIMVPKATSHTMSGNKSAGRPVEDNPTDGTEKSREDQDM